MLFVHSDVCLLILFWCLNCYSVFDCLWNLDLIVVAIVVAFDCSCVWLLELVFMVGLTYYVVFGI